MNKELEALENIKHYDTRVGLHEDDYKIIENALKDTEKYKKALEIIKEKRVDVSWLFKCDNTRNYKHFSYCELTEEEFDFLKEILK